MANKKNQKNKCILCQHQWASRKNNPVACPRCKRYDWQIIKEVVMVKSKTDPSNSTMKKEVQQ